MFATLISGISCKTKKSTTDYKQIETENVSITDNSTVAKKGTVTETTNLSESAKWSDKSFFEAWMSFESDKITITDKDGKVTEITNPRINQKSSQTNEIDKTEQTDSETNKVAINEENKQNDVTLNASKEIQTDLQQSSSTKGKGPVWLWIVIGSIIVICFVFLLNKFLKKSN